MPHLRRIAVPLSLALGVALPVAAPAAASTPSGQAASTQAAAGTTTTQAVPRITARVLRPGNAGTNVRRLQTLLNATGIKVTVSGRYDTATRAAVQRFQIAAALAASGIAGPSTIAALRGAAAGPRTVEAGGGMSFGSQTRGSRRLGQRIPLAKGMSGMDVRQLQSYLRRADVSGAPRPDGEFGAKTAAAVRRFERSEKRSVDGAVDAGDIYALYEEAGVDVTPDTTTRSDPSRNLEPAPLAPGDRARLGRNGLAIAPENAPDAVKKIIAAGNRIAKTPYKWGGGHGRWNDTGYDCSGSVSYALRGANLIRSAMPSGGYMNWGESGRGKWVTIYAHGGHMYMVVAGLRFDTSGRSGNGSRWQTAMRSSSGFRVRHPEGL